MPLKLDFFYETLTNATTTSETENGKKTFKQKKK